MVPWAEIRTSSISLHETSTVESYHQSKAREAPPWRAKTATGRNHSLYTLEHVAHISAYHSKQSYHRIPYTNLTHLHPQLTHLAQTVTNLSNVEKPLHGQALKRKDGATFKGFSFLADFRDKLWSLFDKPDLQKKSTQARIRGVQPSTTSQVLYDGGNHALRQGAAL